jgi:hypothetical protein
MWLWVWDNRLFERLGCAGDRFWILRLPRMSNGHQTK